MQRIQVTLYSKHNCSLCDKGLTLVKQLQNDFPFELEVVDIYQDDALLELYQVMIPVVTINGEEVDFGQLSEEKIRSYLENIIEKNTRIFLRCG